MLALQCDGVLIFSIAVRQGIDNVTWKEWKKKLAMDVNMT